MFESEINMLQNKFCKKNCLSGNKMHVKFIVNVGGGSEMKFKKKI